MVLKRCVRDKILKGFIHYSKEFNPKYIKKEDSLKCIEMIGVRETIEEALVKIPVRSDKRKPGH